MGSKGILFVRGESFLQHLSIGIKTFLLHTFNLLLFQGFCLRTFVVPLSATSAKFMVVFYPLPREELMEEHPLAVHPQFPGLKLLTAECQLGIPSEDLVDKSWGSPFLPAILPAGPWRDQSMIPATQDIRSCMWALLRRVHLPEIKLNKTYLMEKMEAIRKDGESQLVVGQPDCIWPEWEAQSTPTVATSGRSHL